MQSSPGSGPGSRLEKLTEVLELAKKHPLWAAAFSLASVVFSFLIVFVASLPSELAVFQRTAIEADRNIADGERVLGLYGVLGEVIPDLKRLSQHYSDTLGGTLASQHVELRSLIDGIEVVRIAQRRLARATGILNGMRFHEKRLTEFNQAFASDLRTLDGVVDSIEAMYMAKLGADAKSVAAALAGMRQAALKHEEVLASMLTRLHEFRETGESLQKEWQVALAEQHGRLRWFAVKEYVAMGSVLYLIGLGMTVTASVFKGRMKLKTRVPDASVKAAGTGGAGRKTGRRRV